MPVSKHGRTFEAVQAQVEKDLSDRLKRTADKDRVVEEIIRQIDEGSVTMDVDIGYDTSESSSEAQQLHQPPEHNDERQEERKEAEPVQAVEDLSEDLNHELLRLEDLSVRRLEELKSESQRDIWYRALPLRKTFF